MKKIKWTPEIKQKLLNIGNLPASRINQKEGMWARSHACCFGAHLAKEFDVPTGIKTFEYVKGREHLAKVLKISILDLDWCLYKAGAHNVLMSAFGANSWSNPIAEVINNFINMTHVPERSDDD